MSYGPVAPSLAELLHQLAAVAIYQGDWVYLDGTEGGVAVPVWPEPGDAPLALMAGDVAVVRPRAAHDAGAKDAVSFTWGAGTIDVALHRLNGGLEEAWIPGSHAPDPLATSIPVASLGLPAPGDYGDVFVVDDHAMAYIQVTSAGTFGARKYWGYFKSLARNPDGSGESLGEEPFPYPLGGGELDPLLTVSGAPEMEFFGDRDVVAPHAFPFGLPLRPARVGHDKYTVSLAPMVCGEVSGGPAILSHQATMLRWASLSSEPATTMTQVRNPESGERFLAFGDPAFAAFGPLAPEGRVAYRILTYGGPVVP